MTKKPRDPDPEVKLARARKGKAASPWSKAPNCSGAKAKRTFQENHRSKT